MIVEEFEEAVEKSLGDLIRNDDYMAAAMWTALANRSWIFVNRGTSVEYTFRAAGTLVCDIRKEDIDNIYRYMKWYCCNSRDIYKNLGDYGTVHPIIEEGMRRMEWIPDFTEIASETRWGNFENIKEIVRNYIEGVKK
jgi:hypothetical protein